MRKNQPSFSAKGLNKSELPPTFFYSFTIFTGSFLLFVLEPLYAKLILPWFGGSASVWAVCLVFFQSALLLGYLYAHFITRRLKPLHQSILHIGLLLISLCFIPITPNLYWRPGLGSDPTCLILGLLTTQIGLIFFLLSSTSPLIQSWYSRNLPEGKPYILFALSNTASLLALISFPFLIEPNISSSRQVILWSGFFILFVIFYSLVAWFSLRLKSSFTSIQKKDAVERAPVPFQKKLLWIGLAACGSMLLLSITNHLTQNVAPVPLLWILPLSIYLLSFILVFGRKDLYPRKWIIYSLPAVIVILNYTFYDSSFLSTLQLNLFVFCAGLFICCMFCHGELANHKPASWYLTSFYLMISLGGALGAVFVGLIAPTLFSDVYEYPLSLIFISGIALFLLWKERLFVRVYWGIILIFLILVLFQNINTLKKNSLVMMRNFYAPLRVVSQEGESTGKYLTLCNGVVVHGKQFLDPPRSMEATTYYSRHSGAGLALDLGCKGKKRVGIIGLGAGTLAVFGNSGDVFRFYEINPQVIQVANSHFSFLRNSPAQIEIVPGDARLSLESEAPQNYDILAVDAFSGDAVPVHLLTKEAFALYLHHLKPDGILAIHTSNLYLDLAPVVQLLAESFGYLAVCIENEKDDDKLIDLTDWVIVTKNKGFVKEPLCQSEKKEIITPRQLRPWTDDYNSLYTLFNK
jgi:hypothetical protein